MPSSTPVQCPGKPLHKRSQQSQKHPETRGPVSGRISLNGVGCGSRQKLLPSTYTTSRIWRTLCSFQTKVLAKSQDESGTRLPRSSESEVQRALNLKYSEGEESGRCCGEPSSGTTGTPMIAEVPPRVSSICAMKWANILRHTAWFVGVTKASPRGAEC